MEDFTIESSLVKLYTKYIIKGDRKFSEVPENLNFKNSVRDRIILEGREELLED